VEREVAEEEKRRRLELKAIDNEARHCLCCCVEGLLAARLTHAAGAGCGTDDRRQGGSARAAAHDPAAVSGTSPGFVGAVFPR
jgi:hypothetical protein